MASPPPAFFLETPLGASPARIACDELRHATRVRRLGPGDRIVGIDGEGGRWSLEIEREDPGGFLLRALEEPEYSPEPGAAGARLPWVELACAWPRKSRVEAMLGRLVQLGAAAVTPLLAHHRGPEPVPETPPERWVRTAREALKQSRGTWMPLLGRPEDVAGLCASRSGGAMAILDPIGGMSLDTWLRSIPTGGPAAGTRERPIVLVIGPEGGFDPLELTTLLEAGATPCTLGHRILRVETAAEAAMAVAACTLCLPSLP